MRVTATRATSRKATALLWSFLISLDNSCYHFRSTDKKTSSSEPWRWFIQKFSDIIDINSCRIWKEKNHSCRLTDLCMTASLHPMEKCPIDGKEKSIQERSFFSRPHQPVILTRSRVWVLKLKSLSNPAGRATATFPYRAQQSLGSICDLNTL